MKEQDMLFMVVGAGVSGICAAIHLAELGYSVIVVEKKTGLGGILTELDRQFPDGCCGMCHILPNVNPGTLGSFCLKMGLLHPKIKILTSTVLSDINGVLGNYNVVLNSTSTGVDPCKCVKCSQCIEICPVTVPKLIDRNARPTKAISTHWLGNMQSALAINWSECTLCGECTRICQNNAIQLVNDEIISEVSSISGVIVATGAGGLFDPCLTDLYGYKTLQNVVTSIEFECMLGYSSYANNKLIRPDGKSIESIAFIQCVGSRNKVMGSEYCSKICCMSSIKESILAKNKFNVGGEVTIFYMDMRTYGRDFQRYRDEAEYIHGVEFVRTRIHSIDIANNLEDLKLTSINRHGLLIERVFDLVVLATGSVPDSTVLSFIGNCEDQRGICFVEPEVGFNGINESIIHSCAGLISIMGELIPKIDKNTAAINSRTKNEFKLLEYPKIAIVLVDNTDISTKQSVGWKTIEQAIKCQGLFDIEKIRISFSKKGYATIRKLLNSKNYNRFLLVVDCIPSLSTFLERHGFKNIIDNPLLEILDLSTSLRNHPRNALKTVDIVNYINMSIARLYHKRPIVHSPLEKKRGTVVIGGGPSGLSAALALAKCNIQVHLVEKLSGLGGNGVNVFEHKGRNAVKFLINEVNKHRNITVYTGSEIECCHGRVGDFTTGIRNSVKTIPVTHGAVVIATGGRAVKTRVYGLGAHDRIHTHLDFQNKITSNSFAQKNVRTVVMIQCAGSREEPRNYCSRICCAQSLRCAIKLKKLFKGVDVTILYRDIMVMGKLENLYSNARLAGIKFIPFNKDSKPEIFYDDDLPVVKGFNPVLSETFCITADWVSVAVALEANPSENFDRLFGITKTRDHFIKELDSKWRPVDTNNPGVFVCGLAKSPTDLTGAIDEGKAAALRAMKILAHATPSLTRNIAIIRNSMCSMCRLCIDTCPYNARVTNNILDRIEIVEVACHGCGACTSVCTSNASIIYGYEDFTIMSTIESILT